MVETAERGPDPAAAEALRAACAAGLDAALDVLVAMRAVEGAALRDVLDARLAAIARLTETADTAPQRTPEAVRAKLAATIATLAERPGLDPARLHPGGADPRRQGRRARGARSLAGPCLRREGAAGRGGPVGRRLDFLAQEMAREATTFCAKVDDATLTTLGMELRVEIEQLREQVQNVNNRRHSPSRPRRDRRRSCVGWTATSAPN